MRRFFLLAIFAAAIVLIAPMSCGTSRPGLSVTGTVEGVRLAWSESDSSVVGFNVYRENGESGFSKVNETPVAAQWYDDAPGTGTWTYEVKSVDDAGVESDPSNQATISLQ